MNNYCFEAEAYDGDTQRYIDFIGFFSMEAGRAWAEYMERATTEARYGAGLLGFDPATVANVFISSITDDDEDEEE